MNRSVNVKNVGTTEKFTDVSAIIVTPFLRERYLRKSPLSISKVKSSAFLSVYTHLQLCFKYQAQFFPDLKHPVHEYIPAVLRKRILQTSVVNQVNTPNRINEPQKAKMTQMVVF